MRYGNTKVNPVLRDGDIVFVPEGHKIDFRGLFSTLLIGTDLVKATQ
jgi:hypothetical protein